LRVAGYGTELLLDEGSSEDSVRRNRRIDVLLLEAPED
jgi:flagellar motor protein MotB